MKNIIASIVNDIETAKMTGLSVDGTGASEVSVTVPIADMQEVIDYVGKLEKNIVNLQKNVDSARSKYNSAATKWSEKYSRLQLKNEELFVEVGLHKNRIYALERKLADTKTALYTANEKLSDLKKK